MEGGGDERVFRTFDLGWGYFDIDVQAGEGEDEHLEVADGEEHDVVQHDINYSDACDESATAKCDFCDESGSIKLSEVEQAEGRARFGKEVTQACPQDFEEKFAKFSFFNGRDCCDPYGIHKKRITDRLSLITLAMHEAKRSLTPGKKLCKKCLERFHQEVAAQQESDFDGSQESADLCETPGDTVEDFDSQASGPHEWSQGSELDPVNRALDIFLESPVKPYKVGNKAYVEEKILNLNKKIRDMLQIGPPEKEIQKEKDNEGFISSLKEKFDAGDRDDKYRCLTLCPPSWGVNRLVATFQCSRNMALSALELRAAHGPGSFPGKKQASTGLPSDTITKVTEFYLDQDISRNLPGKKDVVMVRNDNGKREAVRKRLLLSNLNEAFAAFKMRSPQVNVGFSKFAELRPPQIILPGQSGTHRYSPSIFDRKVAMMLI